MWHSIEKSPEERKLSKYISAGVRITKQAFIDGGFGGAEDAAKAIDGNYNQGYVLIKKRGERAVKLFKRIGEDSPTLMIDPDSVRCDRVFDLNAMLADINTAAA